MRMAPRGSRAFTSNGVPRRRDAREVRIICGVFSILLLTYRLSGSLYIYTVCTSLFCTTKVVPLPWPSYSGSSSCPRVIGINNQVRGE